MLASLALALLSGLPPRSARRVHALAGELQEDVFQLTDTLSRLHAGLARYAGAARSTEPSARSRCARRGPRDVAVVPPEVCALIARIGCGHSRAPRLSATAPRRSRGAASAVHRAARRRARVDRARARAECRPAPGRSCWRSTASRSREIRARAFARISTTASSRAPRSAARARLRRDATRCWWTRRAGPYELRLAGVAEPVRVAGSRPRPIRAARGRSPCARSSRSSSCRGRTSAALGRGLRRGPPAQPASCAARDELPHAAREARPAPRARPARQRRRSRHVRRALVSYLAHAPFGYFERIEVTPDYSATSRSWSATAGA
jgi:hypothetical protein